jgi:hypothetical protein
MATNRRRSGNPRQDKETPGQRQSFPEKWLLVFLIWHWPRSLQWRQRPFPARAVSSASHGNPEKGPRFTLATICASEHIDGCSGMNLPTISGSVGSMASSEALSSLLPGLPTKDQEQRLSRPSPRCGMRVPNTISCARHDHLGASLAPAHLPPCLVTATGRRIGGCGGMRSH